MVEFVLNGFIFLLIGLQLPEVLRHLSGRPMPQLFWYAVVISLAVILVRILWVFPATYLPRFLSRSLRQRDPYPSWRHVAIVAWTGMRGVVSLAAAMALPTTTDQGNPFPGRDLILFLTFVVILVTLVIQGLSLPPIIRWLGVKDDRTAEKEERQARLKSNQAAVARLEELSTAQPSQSSMFERLRAEYLDRIRQLDVCARDDKEITSTRYSSEYEELLREALRVERPTFLELRNERVINEEVKRRIQRDIDLAGARLGPRVGGAPKAPAATT